VSALWGTLTVSNRLRNCVVQTPQDGGSLRERDIRSTHDNMCAACVNGSAHPCAATFRSLEPLVPSWCLTGALKLISL
jgi:hypothetical protein